MRNPVRSKVKASTIGALLGAVVAIVFELAPEDTASMIDELVKLAEIGVAAFVAGYFKRERHA